MPARAFARGLIVLRPRRRMRREDRLIARFDHARYAARKECPDRKRETKKFKF